MNRPPRPKGKRRALRLLRNFAIGFVALHALALLFAFTQGDAWAISAIVGAPIARSQAMTPPADVAEVLQVERAGARIRAWRFDPAGEPRGTVLLLHGIRDSKLRLVNAARAHVRRGYRASRGTRAATVSRQAAFSPTGWRRRATCAPSRTRSRSAGCSRRRLSVVGTSYGAATAIQYAAIDERVARLVAIAPFASLREVVPAYVHLFLRGALRVRTGLLGRSPHREAAAAAGFDADDACPRCVAPRVHAQTLLIASRADERIPYRQSVAIRDAMGARATLMLVTARATSVSAARPAFPRPSAAGWTRSDSGIRPHSLLRMAIMADIGRTKVALFSHLHA